MLALAKIYFWLFGLVTVGGGIFGYVRKGSVPSIVAGSLLGLLLLVSGFLLPGSRRPGLWLALVVSLLLAGQFVPSAFHGKVTGYYMAPLAVLGVVLALAALFGPADR